MGRAVDNPQVVQASSLVITGAFLHDYTTFVDQDATPSVSGGYGFKTANTVLTTITNFADPPASGGQEIKVVFGDAFTRVAHNANIKLQDAGGVDGYFGNTEANDSMIFSWDGTQWVEMSRSVNS